MPSNLENFVLNLGFNILGEKFECWKELVEGICKLPNKLKGFILGLNSNNLG